MLNMKTPRGRERERQLEAIHPSDVDAVSRDGLSTRRHQGVECVTSDGERWPAVDHIRLMGVRLRSPAEPLSSSIDDVTGVLLRRSSGPPTRQNGPTNVGYLRHSHITISYTCHIETRMALNRAYTSAKVAHLAK